GPLGRTADLLAGTQLATGARSALRGKRLVGPDRNGHGLLTSLSSLAEDVLARVADTLALVGLGLAELADVGRSLTDDLLVDALDGQLGGGLDHELDALGGVDDHRVREAERELELLGTLGDHTVTDTDDFELLLVALGHADDHVVDQGA